MLARCARGLADEPPEVAGVLRGAAYATFKRATPKPSSAESAPVDPNANFVLVAMRETGDIVGAALGDERRRELGAEGSAMSEDEAVTYALANIDPKLLTGPIATRHKRVISHCATDFAEVAISGLPVISTRTLRP